ncbi:hypothetical protein AB6A40_009082 [Gnathostoma spinigerum]|uniref:Uncharacterized protein n=1 Tax=Gnathostoma spinigerum TaxID=75299 RepID=A0ABD6EQZ8_9BILA
MPNQFSLEASLYRMVGKRGNLEIVEKVAALFTECVFAGKEAWHKNWATMELIRPGVNETVAKTQESGLAGHLLASYQRNRKTSVSRSRKCKKCSIDAKQLHDVVRCIQRVWFDLSRSVTIYQIGLVLSDRSGPPENFCRTSSSSSAVTV